MENKMENNKMIINRIFNGSYNKDNIGHEFINLLNPDNSNERYLYICPYGYFSKQAYKSPKYIIFCKTINSKKLKILGISSNHELQHEIFHKEKGNEESIQQEYKRQCTNEISYLGIKLKEYFAKQNNTLLYTFKSTQFYKPKNIYNIYLTTGDTDATNDTKNIFIKIDNKDQLTSTCQYNYIEDKNLSNNLKNIIEKYWEVDTSTSKKLKNSDGTYKSQYIKSFLDIIKKTDDENIFSNWLASILNSNKQLCSYFINELLNKYNTNLSLKKEDNLREVMREHSTSITSIKSDNAIVEENSKQIEKQNNNAKRIDLWIETNDYIIYIENKIKSGINGYTEKKHDWQGEEIHSQLSNYYKYAQNYNESNYNSKKTIIPIILAPNYSEIFKSEILSRFECGKKYCKIKYSDLSDIFKNYNENYQLLPEIFFDEFMKAIDRHTKDEPLSIYEEIYQRIIDFAVNNVELEKW